MPPRTYSRWIFTKERGYTPDGTLQLGQILARPFEPGQSLMPKGPLKIPEDILQEDTSQESVTMDSMDDLTAMFGLWVKVAGLPASAGAGAKVDRSNEISWRFEKLRNKQFSPSLDYVKAAMRHGDVPDYIKGWRFEKRVYMITGIRTAHGAKMAKKDSQSKSMDIKAEGDLSAVGTPASIGGKGSFTASSSNVESFEKASDFVYAYRLNEVNYRGRLSHKPFKDGETSGVGDSVEVGKGSGAEEAETVDFDVEGADDDDFDGGEFEVQAFNLVSGQDCAVEYECLVAMDMAEDADN